MKIKKSTLREAVRAEVISQLKTAEAKRKNLTEIAEIYQHIVKKNGLK